MKSLNQISCVQCDSKYVKASVVITLCVGASNCGTILILSCLPH